MLRKIWAVLRPILAVIAGMVVGTIGVTLGEMGCIYLYPLPANVKMDDPAAFEQYVRSLPILAFVIVLASHGLGSFLAGIVASLITKPKAFIPALIVGLLFQVAGIMNLFALHHPLWFIVIDMLLYIPLALAGMRLILFLKPEN